jgi:hypothetical protein
VGPSNWAGQDRHLRAPPPDRRDPASHSIGVEARDKIGGRLVLDYLVREGDQLPKKGKKTFKAGESLKRWKCGLDQVQAMGRRDI